MGVERLLSFLIATTLFFRSDDGSATKLTAGGIRSRHGDQSYHLDDRSRLRQLFRQEATKPMPAKPRIIIAHVEGLWTAAMVTIETVACDQGLSCRRVNKKRVAS
jgi:hypothetical protein